MKKKILWISSLILAMLTVIFSLTFLVSAESSAPVMSIDYCNLSLRDAVCVKYAAKLDNAETATMLVWETPEAEYVYGTQDAELENSGTQTIGGKKYYVFDYTGLATKQMTDEIYARTYYKTSDGTEYYSPIKKFSILEYAMTALSKPSTAAPLADLLRSMLNYGAAAQVYQNYNTDRLANATFYRLTVVGGTLSDGMNTGLYPAGASVTLVAPATDSYGMPFDRWEDANGNPVTMPLTTVASDMTYTPVYKKASEGLVYTLNADQISYSVSGGTCTDAEVVIPPMYNGLPVTVISDSAFAQNTAMTGISIPNSVTKIGGYAFWKCSNLTDVTLPDSVEYIYGNAFLDCSGLTNVTIGKNVNTIYADAFSGCTGLKDAYITDMEAWLNVSLYSNSSNPACYGTLHILDAEGKEITELVIPDGVTSIGACAFYHCKNLTSVTIPDSVTSIGFSAFYGCTGLTDAYITDMEAWLNVSLDNSASNPAYYGTLHILDAEGKEITELVIPDGVTSIGDYTFYNCKNLTSVTIPDSVTSISDYAFDGCIGLQSVSIGTGVTSIGNSAFRNCTGLTSITIPDSVTSIGNQAFDDCTGLTSITIPDSVTSIGQSAFYSCKNLTSITIPDSVTSIGASAFNSCTGLTSITIPDSVTSIGFSAFYGCTGLTDAYITDVEAWLNVSLGNSDSNPACYGTLHLLDAEGKEITELVIPDGVTSIGNYAFRNCKNLTSVTIPDSVTSIGSDAFYNCTGLKDAYITDVEAWCNVSLGNGFSNPAYYGTLHILDTEGKEITELVIPDGVTSIGSYAFYNRKNLTSVTIPNSVTSIGSYAFYGCTGLTSVTLGNGLTSIGEWAFRSCTGLTSITISDSVTSIGASAFYSCKNLTSITIPDSVTSIGASAFNGCTGLKDVYVTDVEAWFNVSLGDSYSNPAYYGTLHLLDAEGKEITELVIPDGVTSIGSYAFRNCKNLTSVTIPNSVTSIGTSAFFRCTVLTSVTLGNGVTSIGNNAFDSCTGLTDVYITDIAAWLNVSLGNLSSNPAYYGTLHLLDAEGKEITELVIPDGVTSIGDYAFRNCKNLTSVTIPNSVTSIGDYAFYNCKNLTSVTIPDSVTSIGNYAFYLCKNLTSVTIPDSVTSIGDSAFENCTGLTSITIPDSVTSIGNSAFGGCTGLTSITIPDSVTRIDSFAFRNCTGLTSVTLGNGVTRIGNSAFAGCTGLTSIIYDGTMEQWAAVSKGYDWKYKVLATEVICSDGEVAF